MKTLSDHTLIYDSECPLCKGYTKAFINTGMLDEQGRMSYCESAHTSFPNIDWNRARNEIALINKRDYSVTYGVDSIMTVLEYNLPILKPLFNFKPFYFFIRQLYFFISFNRKIIIPGKSFTAPKSCTPDINYTYRWAYIIFTWLLTSMILVRYGNLMVPIVPASAFFREFLICGGQILFQGVLVALLAKDKAIHYLGNMMTISLGGGLLLSPMFLVTGLIDSSFVYMIYFLMVVALMFVEHVRRVKFLGLPWIISASWVIYRLIILSIIL